MENDEEDVIGVTFERLDATFTEVIPNFDGLVVAGSHKIWPIRARVEVYVVDTFFMSVHGEIGIGGSQRPHLDGPIETGRDEGVGIFGIYGDIHNVVGVTLVDLQGMG